LTGALLHGVKQEKYLNSIHLCANEKLEISPSLVEDLFYTSAEIDKFKGRIRPCILSNTDWTMLAAKRLHLQQRASLTLSGGTDKIKILYLRRHAESRMDRFKDGVWKFKQRNIILVRKCRCTAK
jgi:hypothetical protein